VIWSEIVLVGLAGMFVCLIVLEAYRDHLKRRRDRWHKRALKNRALRNSALEKIMWIQDTHAETEIEFDGRTFNPHSSFKNGIARAHVILVDDAWICVTSAGGAFEPVALVNLTPELEQALERAYRRNEAVELREF
jgi:hypothetical protein